MSMKIGTGPSAANRGNTLPTFSLLPDEEKQFKEINKGKLFQRLIYVRQHARYIAPTEMYLLLDPAEVQSTSAAHFGRVAHSIERWRNIFVLFPLLLTWFGLSLAAGEYAQTIALNPKSIDVPFLKLWVDGFPQVQGLTILGFLHLPGNVLRFFSFSTVALIDVTLFFMLIFLTLLAQWIEARATRKAANLANWLHDELFRLERESVTMHEQGSDREIALNRLSDLLAEMRTVVASFDAASQRQSQGLDELLKGTNRVAQTVDGIEVIFQRGRETYDKLDQALPRLEGQFNTMAVSQDKVSDALQRIADGVQNSAQAIHDLAGPFVAAGVSGMAQKVAAQHQQMLRDNNQVLAKQAEITRSINEIAQQVQSIQPPPHKVGFWRRLIGKK